jgi:hypothetical protein
MHIAAARGFGRIGSSHPKFAVGYIGNRP